jgi:hypothetical protein
MFPLVSSGARACPIVRRRDRAYLRRVKDASAAPIGKREHAPAPAVPRTLVIAAAAVAVALAATAVLWAHYGTALFYEMILAGLAACL